MPDLTDAAAAETGTDIHTSGTADDLAALRHAGFEDEIVWEEFNVPFSAALAAMRTAHPPRGVAIERAADVDPRQLFGLDNEVRSRVPGTDNWGGNWDWFRAELTDPAAYLVALDVNAGRLLGLARIWRNDNGPRFGLIGVVEEGVDRRTGPFLLRRVLEDASKWGYSSFTAETATTNRWIHRRLAKLDAIRIGLRTQMVRRS